MPESLRHQRIADQYTSLLHVSGASIASWDSSSIGGGKDKAHVYDGAGNVTGITLSSADDRVVINNYIQPEGWSYQTEWLDAFFPINSVILTTNFKNPGDRINGTKWILQSKGIYPVGVGTGTDKNNDSFTFTAGGPEERRLSTLANGDIAGEFLAGVDIKDLPEHSHTTDTKMFRVPASQDGQGTNVGFIFYFGDTINPQGLAATTDQQYLDADKVEAFEYNTTYKDIPNYRDYLIKQRYRSGRGYTDADFNPRFANQTLKGWAPVAAGGAGWGGTLWVKAARPSGFISDRIPRDDPRWIERVAQFDAWKAGEMTSTGEFLGNAPRPPGIPWTFEGREYKIMRALYDPRPKDRVHPGEFSRSDLIKARDFIIDVLGVTKAAEALTGVNRLREYREMVEQAKPGVNTYHGIIPMNKIIQSTTTGRCVSHNNVPPSFPVYLWRRVALTYVAPNEVPPSTQNPQEFVISSNKKSTRGNPFNLSQWARDKGWNGSAPCRIVIRRGVYIYSDDPDYAAMAIDQFPGGLTLVNNGFIMGRGGDGGFFNSPGGDGGTAIDIPPTGGHVTIENHNGAIAGGGGGGGGGNVIGSPGNANSAIGSGGGGGAGGGRGGTSGGIFPSLGGAGGRPGRRGGHGSWTMGGISHDTLVTPWAAGDIVTDGWGPLFDIFPGVGGQAGGSGSGRHPGARPYGNAGSGGGGGRVLSRNAFGGGGGGKAGTQFSGVNFSADSITATTMRTTPPGPVFASNGSYTPSNPTKGWLGGYPPPHSGEKPPGFRFRLGNFVLPGVARNLPGRPVRVNPVWEAARRAFMAWEAGSAEPATRGNTSKGNFGYRYRANNVNGQAGIPYIVTTVRGYNAYLSPTGWNGDFHWSSYVHGGYKNRPGAYFDPVGDWSAGGGGWGADGGSVPGADRTIGGNRAGMGGKGGKAVDAIANMPDGGSSRYTINGGVVYGESNASPTSRYWTR